MEPAHQKKKKKKGPLLRGASECARSHLIPVGKIVSGICWSTSGKSVTGTAPFFSSDDMRLLFSRWTVHYLVRLVAGRGPPQSTDFAPYRSKQALIRRHNEGLAGSKVAREAGLWLARRDCSMKLSNGIRSWGNIWTILGSLGEISGEECR
ncbi:hypothetical protein BO78DRAFT_44305 [Aspergillus sclerotiicarbonarius CBS 121057]|uniref:Uncharacterized protein n=1 Tax=Aspergillus sclerotiicarbonarius (strain CBS 121057 / IBT 28362) TaxID=1448318 RepID=A0A319FLG9_ASPSB|nr:hypothetical protein BO78DRAFT_44305 [Aspergillus sclerotiicarbonarius CBS 121057]